MGCSASKDKTENPKNDSNTKPTREDSKGKGGNNPDKITPIDARTTNLVFDISEKKKISRIMFDLQNNFNHKFFLDFMTSESNKNYGKLPDVSLIKIRLSDHPQDSYKDSLFKIMEKHFPAKTKAMEVQSYYDERHSLDSDAEIEDFEPL